MTKRYGNFEASSNKRAKINQDVDDLWGEELDASVIDDCFKLASQVVEKKNFSCTQLNNVSILPTYNAFTIQKNLFTSTQSEPNLNLHKPTTSKNTGSQYSTRFVRNNSSPLENINRDIRTSERASDAQTKVQRLQEKCEFKDGEVAILRSQLKQTKKNLEVELTQKQKEWFEKLTAKTKEMNAIQSELEFKDLEIMNLKHKIVEIAKFNDNIENGVTCTQVVARAKTVLRNTTVPAKTTEDTEITKLQPIIDKWYPLLTKIPSTIFTVSKREKYFIYKKCFKNSASLLSNCFSEFDDEQANSMNLVSNFKLNIEGILNDIGTLMVCSSTELGSAENSLPIKKVVCVSLQLVHIFCSFLKKMERNLQTEDLIHADTMYLKNEGPSVNPNVTVFDGKELCTNEIGINARQSIAFLAELVPFNSNLRSYLLENQCLVVNADEINSGCFSVLRDKPEDFTQYLNVLLICVKLIGKLRKPNQCVGFLSSVTKLLANLAQEGEISQKCPLFLPLAREIIFARPNVTVLYEMSYVLKNVSLDKIFINEMCTMTSQNALKLNVKEGFLTYNLDSCVFHVLSALYENNMAHLNESEFLKVGQNLLNFQRNALAANLPWLYCREYKVCDCLCQFNKLCVKIIWKCLANYKERRKQLPFTKDLWRDYKCLFSISINLLHILNCRMCMLIEKYITICSRYKVIVSRLFDWKDELRFNDEEVKILEKLTAVEEMTNVSPSKFSNTQLWD